MTIPIVENMVSENGNAIANQFIITVRTPKTIVRYFKSYDSIIAMKVSKGIGGKQITLDKNTWDYSKTTGKYRNMFLGETKKETQAKIDKGIYHLADLNK